MALRTLQRLTYRVSGTGVEGVRFHWGSLLSHHVIIGYSVLAYGMASQRGVDLVPWIFQGDLHVVTHVHCNQAGTLSQCPAGSEEHIRAKCNPAKAKVSSVILKWFSSCSIGSKNDVVLFSVLMSSSQ